MSAAKGFSSGNPNVDPVALTSVHRGENVARSAAPGIAGISCSAIGPRLYVYIEREVEIGGRGGGAPFSATLVLPARRASCVGDGGLMGGDIRYIRDE